MASRTQMRLAQLTGSFGNLPGQISDLRPEQASAANAAALLMSSGSLLGPLSEMASAIKRIHGADQFAKAGPGQFFVDIKPHTDNSKDLGSSSRKFAELHLGTSINLKGFGITDIKDEDDMASNSATALATQQSIKAYVDAQDHDDDLGIAGDSGTGTVDLDAQSLTITGGTGLTSAASGQAVTVTLDNTAVNTGQYGSGAVSDFTIPEFTVDAQGRITQASEKVIQDATVSAKGVASFAPADFAVTSGAVTIKAAGVLTAQIADSQITNALMADDAIDSAEIADGSIDLAHMSANSVDSDQYVDGSIDTAHYAAGSVDAAAMGANSVDSSELVNGSVDLSHMSVNSIDSDQYVDGSIDTIHIADAQITVAKMAANSVDSDQYADGSIDTIHIAADQITQALIADNAVQKEHLNPNVAGSGLEQHSDDSLRLAAAAAGNGLTGGAGSALSVDLESANALAVTSNGLDLKNTIVGNRTFSDDIIVAGNLTVNGAQFKIDGTTVVMDDTLMEMGTVGKVAPTGETGRDLGLLLHRHDGSAASINFMGWDEATDKFKMKIAVTDDGDGTISGGSAAALEVGALTAASAVVTGEADLQGDVNLGNAGSDDLFFNGKVASAILPKANIDLGSASDKFRTIYAGTSVVTADLAADRLTAPLNANSQAITNVDINSGTIDGATIATSNVTVGVGKTLDVSAGALTLANNQISGDKVEGGTIAGITISALVATSADINGGTIDGTVIGAATPAAGSFAAVAAASISASGNVNFDGNVILGNSATDDITFSGKIQNGALVPRNDNQVDLGAAGSEFKDLYITGTGNIDALVADTADINNGTIDNTVVGAQVQAAGDFTAIGGVARGSALFTTLGANGNVTLGDSSADTVSVLGSVLGNVKLTGQNAGGNLITLDIPDAGDPRTIAVPDASGVFAVSALASSGVGLNSAGQIQMGITGATQHSGAPENGDKLLLWDDSASAHKKVLLSQVRNYLAITYTQKAVFEAVALTAGQPLDVGTLSGIDAGEWHAAAAVAQEVYCNGQLLARGADAAAGMDWYKHSVSGQIKFAFDLEADDVLQFVLRA